MPGHVSALERRRGPRRALRSRSRRGVALAAALLALLALAPRKASAQACCVGASGLTPGTLTTHERALVGIQHRVAATFGTYPRAGTFYGPAPGRDLRLEASVFASYRFAKRGQIGLQLPLLTTFRRVGESRDARPRLGDTSLLGRYDLVRDRESSLPGIALLVGLQLPTGTPADRARSALGADITGIGTWEGLLGAAVERSFGPWLLHGTVLVGARAPRDVHGVEEQLGLRALYLLAFGYVFEDEASLALAVTHGSEGDVELDGRRAPGTGFRTTQASLVVLAPLSAQLRLRVVGFSDVPPLGENRLAQGGATMSIAMSWY